MDHSKSPSARGSVSDPQRRPDNQIQRQIQQVPVSLVAELEFAVKTQSSVGLLIVIVL